MSTTATTQTPAGEPSTDRAEDRPVEDRDHVASHAQHVRQAPPKDLSIPATSEDTESED